MNFNFIPYRLNADLSHFKEDVEYICSDNGVDLYKVKKVLIKPILGISVSDVNLYFFEGSLITVYIHLAENPEYLSQVKEVLENCLKSQGKSFKTESGMIAGWNTNTEFLSLINDRKHL